jgi:Raf kinase inhibitor-like YbhB/YbcL family protein
VLPSPLSRALPIATSALAVPAACLAGCGGGASHHAGSVPQPAAPAPAAGGRAVTLTSPAFASGATIPARFTCAGADVSPPLTWSVAPAGTGSLAVVMVDLDTSPRFVHWALAGLPPQARSLAAGAHPAGGVAGRNGFGTTGYRGPCPPPGAGPHRYELAVYALPSRPRLAPGFAFGQLRGALGGALAVARLQGRFGR